MGSESEKPVDRQAASGGSRRDQHRNLNARQRRTLEAVFGDPPPANIRWRAIEALLAALGADVWELAGSRVGVKLHGVKAVFHRPHPGPEATRPQVRAVRRFLREAGVVP